MPDPVHTLYCSAHPHCLPCIDLEKLADDPRTQAMSGSDCNRADGFEFETRHMIVARKADPAESSFREKPWKTPRMPHHVKPSHGFTAPCSSLKLPAVL